MKLISLNMEGDKHLDLIIPFLKRENPDVVCLQELFKETVGLLAVELGMTNTTYLPSAIYEGKEWSIGILSKHSFLTVKKEYYHKPGEQLLVWNDAMPGEEMNSRMRRGYIMAEVQVGNDTFRFITTHFTWSGKAENTQLQVETFEKLLAQLQQYDEYVLCGDFNIPRGTPLWERIKANLKDNIPAAVKSSLDPVIHKVGHLNLMIDGMFSTPGYKVSDVRIVSGVSDHQAVVATIGRHGS